MNLQFIKSSEKKKYIEKLNEQFGIEKLPYLMLETGKEKVRAFSGDLIREDIIKISGIANVEIVGAYLFKKETNVLRLSFDGSITLKDEIKKKIVELNEFQANEWMLGNNIALGLAKGIHVVKNGKDFLGCGISDGRVLINFVPKERRVRKTAK